MSESLGECLRRAGYRLTAPRQAVLQVVESEEGHLVPAEVLEKGRAIYPALGRATVYRTLGLLSKLGLIRPMHSEDGSLYFVHIGEGHHHFVCFKCGMVIEFEGECCWADVTQALAEQFGVEITGHLLELYGLCQRCREESALKGRKT